MLCKINQTENGKYCMISLGRVYKSQTQRNRKESGGYKGLGTGEMRICWSKGTNFYSEVK